MPIRRDCEDGSSKRWVKESHRFRKERYEPWRISTIIYIRCTVSHGATLDSSSVMVRRSIAVAQAW
jgi:hypothetical protein